MPALNTTFAQDFMKLEDQHENSGSYVLVEKSDLERIMALLSKLDNQDVRGAYRPDSHGALSA